MPRPKDYELVDDNFATESQRDAAEAVVEMYGTGEGETQDISEIAERSGWSRTHISNVIERYFEPVGNHSDQLVDTDKALRKAYAEGYDAGFEKGFEQGLKHAKRTNKPMQ